MTQLSNINTLAELERLGISWIEGGENEVRTVCPFHQDETPSCCINIEKNVYICQASSCKNSGDIISFIARVLGANRRVVYQELAERYDLDTKKTIDPNTVETYHKSLSTKKTLVRELRARGIDADLARKARLGEHKGRVTIPIYQDGEVVNVRHYLPGAPGNQKFRNTKGFGKTLRLYLRDDQLNYDKIWICGGELKALAASRFLNHIKAGAVSPSGGEGSWDRSWNDLFVNKDVYICMDIDQAGKKAAAQIGSHLYGKCNIHIVDLPLDKKKYPKGDLNDFIASEDRSLEEFQALMDNAQEFSPEGIKKAVDEGQDPAEITFLEAIRENRGGEILEFSATVVALDETPYQVPELVAVNCDRNQKSCPECPVYGMPIDEDAAYTRVNLPKLDQAILQMQGANNKILKMALLDCIGIPQSCRSVRFKIDAHRNLYDARISPVMDFHQDEDPQSAVQQAFVFTPKLDVNLPYRMTGIMTPSPKNQKATFIIKDVEAQEDTLEDFSLTPELHDELKLFRPEQWTVQGIRDKLADINGDLSNNVTRIFDRPDIHTLIDITYHSVLGFEYRGRPQNGWINCLIIGDSSLGKSEASSRLHEYYRLGTRLDCRSASFAGIVGGVQQFDGGQYYISWGVIPKNDRGLAVLDEAKGLREETIGRMTDMRSSGWAEIPKIEHRRAPARTRLLWISNPRKGSLDDYAYGINSVLEFSGSPEAARRFDVVGVFAKDDSIDIYSHVEEGESPKYSHESCRNLILYSWSRKPSQVKISDFDLVEDCAKKMRETYTEDIPIVDAGSIHIKILKVASAFAARTYSTDDEDTILVRNCHILYAVEFMQRLYSSFDAAYDEFSRVRRLSKKISNKEEVVKYLLNDLTEIESFIEGILNVDGVHREDIEDWCGIDLPQARSLIGFLTRHRCLTRNDRFTYRKTPEFTKMLRDLEHKVSDMKPEVPEM